MSGTSIVSRLQRRMMSHGFKSFLLVLVCTAIIIYSIIIKATNHLSRLTHFKPTEEISPQILTIDGAWCWFQDPRAIYYEGSKYKRTYVGWVNSFGDLMIGGFDHGSKKVLSEVTIRPAFQKDDHSSPSLLILDSGHVVIFYSAHNGDKMFYKISKNPEDIDDWLTEKVVNTNADGSYGYTYPRPFLVGQGQKSSKIVLFWRGGDWKPTFSEQIDKQSWDWTTSKTLISGSGARPYIKYESSDIAKDPKIHMAFTDGHPRDEPGNSIYYACLQNKNMYKADGTSINPASGSSIDPSEAHLVYNARKEEGSGKAWIWDIAIDQFGRPVIVYVRFPSAGFGHIYHYAKWTGREWEDNEVVDSGSWFPETPKEVVEPEPNYSGGIFLDHSNPSRLVLSRKVDGVFEIEVWTTLDNGKNWYTGKVTSESNYNNVRPIIPFGYKSSEETLVLWISGQYTHFTDFHTSIKFAFV